MGNMKTVLCYGDSLTWGYNAETIGRHDLEDRWPMILQKTLGDGVQVIAEGLNGRTTVYDDHTADCDRNGARILPTLLHSHGPLDLVIIMLGANDMKPVLCGTAFGAMQGMERLIELVRHHAWSFEPENATEILIVAPPALCETANAAFAAMFAGGVEQSSMLASLYADLADEKGCGFFDAGSVARTTPLDGVHLDAENTRAIGRGLEPIVRMMLGVQVAGLVLRAAERRDAADLTILVDIASHGFATWLWQGAVMRGDRDSAMEQGRARLRMDGEMGGWTDATVAEWDGEIAGISIGYDLDETVRAIAAPHPVIKPLLDLQVAVIGSRFIDSLGVYRHHRGKGIGRALLAHEIVKAQGRQVSLITESHNETAQALYASNGFVEMARLAAAPLFENSKRHDWVLFAQNSA